MKSFFIALAIILALFVGALFIVPKFINVNSYKPNIVKLLHDETGFDYAIDGNIELNILPNLSLKANKIYIKSAANNLSDNGLKIYADSVSLELQLIPLLKGQIQVDSIAVLSPDVVITKLTKKANVGETKEKVAINKENSGKADSSKFSLMIKRLAVSNGRVTIIDSTAKGPQIISEINIEGSLTKGKIGFVGKSVLQNILDKNNKLMVSGDLLIVDKKYSSDFKITLDKISGYGNIKADLAGKVPNIDLSLNINEFTLDTSKISGTSENNTDILVGEAVAKNDAKTSNFSWSNKELPFKTFRKFNGNLNILINNFSYNQTTLTNVNITDHILDGLVVQDIKLDAAGGKITVNSELNAKTDLPEIKHKLSFTGLDVEKLSSINPLFAKFSGKLNFDLDVTSKGTNQEQLINNLTGKANVNALEGKLKKIDLLSMVENVMGSFNVVGSNKDTSFDEIKANFVINNGVAHNEDLSVKATDLSLVGNGDIDLPKLLINFRLTPTIVSKTIKNEGNKLSVPIVISGSLLAPVYSPDLASPLRNIIENPKGAVDTLKGLRDNLKKSGKDIKGNIKDQLLNAF